jgi:hypothetical protein
MLDFQSFYFTVAVNLCENKNHNIKRKVKHLKADCLQLTEVKP